MSRRVILIHGLGRTWRSMYRLGRYLRRHNFEIRFFSYRSRKETMNQAGHALAEFLEKWYKEDPGEGRIHLVTHSMGGILARYCEAEDLLPHVDKIVMLAPPNQGSEVADWLNSHFSRFFKFALGPHGPRLGTGENSYVHRLPDTIQHETGVIAGTRNGIFITRWLLSTPNDGLVTVKSTQLNGIKDWLPVKAGHTMIMNHLQTRKLIIKFLRTGSFVSSSNTP